MLFAAKVPRQIANVTIDPPPGGKPIKVSAYRGKTILIAIISTDCGACEDSIPALNQIQKDYAGKGVQILGAAVNSGAVNLIKPFIQRYKPVFPMGVMTEDTTRTLADFSTKDRPFVPIFIFVDRKGTVREEFFGDSPFFKDEDRATRALLDQLVK